MADAPFIKAQPKTDNRIARYGLMWNRNVSPVAIELRMIRQGGQWTKTNGEPAGNGLYFHFRKFQELVWPTKIWRKGPFVNHWAEKCLEVYLGYTYTGVMGCAASGKSFSFGGNALTDWYAAPDCTTVLLSSTDLKSLELRVWGMVKAAHREAKENSAVIPGHLIEGKQMIIQDEHDEFKEGRDFKNGLLAVPLKRGTAWVGLGPLVGIHNKRVRLIADECNLCPRVFLDSVSNLAKCEDFKLIGLGNPNETTNAHGVLCEPHFKLGGWEAGIDQRPGTKTWQTRYPNGICLQLPGSDSPNKDTPDGDVVPFPFLITPKQIQEDAEIWGADDWHYKMMDEAQMPRGQGSRRVLTRQMCTKFGAFKPAKWRDTRRTQIAFLDAAYRGVGGDRCIFGVLEFGPEAEADNSPIMTSAIINQDKPTDKLRQILSLVSLEPIHIASETTSAPAEDQIVAFVTKECLRLGIKPENFFFDAGMRTSLVTAFSRMWTPMVNSIDCGGKPTEELVSMEIQKPAREYYSKFITELWFSVRLVVESSQFRGMTEALCTEFGQREWKMVAGNKIEVETKDEMKEKSGRSPDLADAVAIGVHGAKQRGFVIARAVAPPDRTRGKDWRDTVRDKAKALHRSGDLNYAA